MRTCASCTAMVVGLWLATAGQDSVLVGIMERPQCHPEARVAVRALFAKRAGEWTSLAAPEAARGVNLADVSWTVTLQGRRLGTVQTSDPGFHGSETWTYPRDRFLALPAGQVVPRIDNVAGSLVNQCGVPTDRPLVVVSRPSIEDPDEWHPFRVVQSTTKTRLLTPFRERVGAVLACAPGTESPARFEYTPTDLIVWEAYEDRRSRRLVGLGLDPERYGCDGPPGVEWSNHWFLITQEIRYLGNTLSLVDSADYDGDGVSELVFWHSQPNEDGYTLFYNSQMRGRVDYYWTYH